MTPEERAKFIYDMLTKLPPSTAAVGAIEHQITGAIAQERERCARIAESHESHEPSDWAYGFNDASITIARAIRADEGSESG